MLNSDSRKRSAVGRISRDDGEARLRPFSRPPTTRIKMARRARARPRHPRLDHVDQRKTWMAGASPAMTACWECGTSPRTLWASLLFQRLEVAPAVIAALRTAARAVAVGLELVAGARFLAAGSLHQHA